MRNTRQFCAIVLLIVTLALSTLAGEMHAPGLTVRDEIQTPRVTVAREMQKRARQPTRGCRSRVAFC